MPAAESAGTTLPAKFSGVFARATPAAQQLMARMQASISKLRADKKELKAAAVGAAAKAGSAGLVVAGGVIGGVLEGAGVPDVGPVKVEEIGGAVLVLAGIFVPHWSGSVAAGLGAGMLAHALGERTSGIVDKAFAAQRAENKEA